MHFVIVPRHLENYCGEGQSFDLDFGKIQDIDKPLVTKCNIDQVLKRTLKLYFSDTTANNILHGFNQALARGENAVTVEDIILMKDMHEGKYRYSLLQKLGSLSIQFTDATRSVPEFPLILAEVFEI